MATVPVNIDDLQLHGGTSEDDADIATETRYGVRPDGNVIELHLTEGNATDYDKAVGRYLDAGRVIGTVARHGASASRSNGRRAQSQKNVLSSEEREHNAEVRRWARENGGATTLKVSGRVPNEIVAAYAKGDIAAVKAWNEARLAKGIEAVDSN